MTNNVAPLLWNLSSIPSFRNKKNSFLQDNLYIDQRLLPCNCAGSNLDDDLEVILWAALYSASANFDFAATLLLLVTYCLKKQTFFKSNNIIKKD